MRNWTRRKPLVPPGERSADALPPSPSWPQLMAMGVGAIIGTGILTLIGVDCAGPAAPISFAIADAGTRS